MIGILKYLQRRALAKLIARSDPSIMGLAAAAVLGGIVVAGSNRSTANEASNQLSATETRRAELISQLELQTVSGRDSLQ